jgi:nucleotide-binding universal stress UspA family protein
LQDHVIAAYDGSPGAHDALALAVVLADAAPDGPAPLTVTTVWRELPLDDAEHLAEYARHEDERGEERLASARAIVGDRPDTRFVVAHGTSPAAGLQRAAREHDASCIVVGTSHQGPLGRVLPGSVTEQTLHGAPCHVAVAPAGFADEPRTIATVGVAFDDSAESHQALITGVELARRHHATLRLVQVLDEQVVAYGGMAGEAALERIREQAHAVLRRAADGVEGVDAVETVLLEGSVPVRLAAASRSLDMLVVGSRSNGPIRRVLLGSVSSRLARETACALIAVPHSAASSDAPDAA